MAERVRVEDLNTDRPRTRLLRIQVKEDALRQGLQRVAREVSRHLRIPGFRPGRAPYRLVEQRVGRQYLLEEFLEKELESLLAEAFGQAGVEPAFEVELRSLEWEPLTLEIEVPLEPKVDLDDYLSIRIPYEEPTVTEEEVERYIQREFLMEHATWEPVDEPAQEGDQVDAIVTIRVGDEVVEDNADVVVEIDPESQYYLPGFPKALLGVKPGEEKTFTLPVPEGHPWREHGEEATFTVQVQEVKRLRFPELTSDLLQEIDPDADTPEALREKVREFLQTTEAEVARQAYLDKVYDALLERVTVEYPPLLLERLVERHLEDLKTFAEKEMRVPFERFLEALGKSEEQLREEVREDLDRTLRKGFIADAVLQKHQPELTPEDFQQTVIHFILEHGMKPEDINRRLEQDAEFREDFMRHAYTRKAEDILIAIARGEWQEPEGGEAEAGETEGTAEEAAPVTEEAAEAPAAAEAADDATPAAEADTTEERPSAAVSEQT